ncbi:radical SAM family heme chaperone HemW [Flavobacteriaceae bacterium R38]|nr:radical SAM family heme chaperone HemW [Flavobacteriaceae bacterium R38]
MSGIYIHFPFCKQACHYCDFHFSTSLHKKEAMLNALKKEIKLRKSEFKDEVVETIYFGGGTPSLLSMDELRFLLDEVYENYNIVPSPEITLEANPDDLSSIKINDLYKSPVNRLSIGIQSFFEEDLKLMNRAHNAEEASRCIKEAQDAGFENISIDLIYGIPGMSNERWIQNIEKTLAFQIPHISSYALTVEPRTALEKLIEKGRIAPVDDELAHQHFLSLVTILKENNFVHYELSNFGKPGFFSKNNTAYWLGKKYIGIGPSAHSYDGNHRGWNIANNPKYIKALSNNELPLEIETLSKKDRYNEYIMTGLRTIWGVSTERVVCDFGMLSKQHLLKQAEKYIKEGLLEIVTDKATEVLRTTRKGKFLCDGIASDLFLLNLEK